MFRQFLAAEAQKKTPADEQYIEELSNVPTPYNLFRKEWNKEAVKKRFVTIHNEKIDAIEAKHKEELLKRKIYIRTFQKGASVSGLDNGFDSYEVYGPVVKILYFTEKELAKLKAKGKTTVYADGTPLLYKSLKTQDGRGFSYPFRGSILEDYDGYVGKYTRYRSTFGKVWYSPLEADPRPPSAPQAGKTFAELHRGIQGM